MANNTKFNLDKINQMLTPKSTIKRYSEFVKNSREGINDAFSYAQKMGAKVADGVSGAIDDVARRFGKNTGAAPTSSVGQYQRLLSDGRVAPASSVTGESAPSAIPTVTDGYESIATAKSYNAAPATEPSVSSPASEESVSEGKKYNSGYKTDAVGATSYLELLKEQQQLIDKSKSEAYEEADDQLNIDMRDAQANYQQNDPRYGATAENLLEQGLGDSGYGEYLAGKREEQLTDERMAARSRHSYARLEADKAHDAATSDLNTMRGQYAQELDAEFKAAYNEVLSGVGQGVYSADIAKSILEQYAGGELSSSITSALTGAENRYNLINGKNVIGTMIDYMDSKGIAPSVDTVRDYLTGQPGITDTQINNIITAMFDENGKYLGNSSGTSGDTGLGGSTNTGKNGSNDDNIQSGGGSSDTSKTYGIEEMKLGLTDSIKAMNKKGLNGVEALKSIIDALETLIKGENNERTYTAEENAACNALTSALGGLVVSSATYNTNGSALKASKEGDNLSVVMDGTVYRVEHGGKAGTEVQKAASDNSIPEGAVFGYAGNLYVMTEDGAYALRARSTFLKGGYGKLWKAVYSEAVENISAEGYTKEENSGADVKLKGTGEGNKKEKDSEKASVSGTVSRGYANASKINNGAKDGEGWIKVNVNDSQYKVKLNGEVNAGSIDASKVNENEVFLIGDDAYMKMDGKIYDVDKRWLGGGQYKNMVKAIKDNVGDQIVPEGQAGYNDNAVNLSRGGDESNPLNATVVNTFGSPRSLEQINNKGFGDTIFISLDDKTYSFEIDAVLGSGSDAYNAAVTGGVEAGNIFAHGEDMYVMADNKCYKLGAASGLANTYYDKFKTEISKKLGTEGSDHPFGNFRADSGAGDSVESGSATEEGEGSSGGGNASGVTPGVVPDGTVTPPIINGADASQGDAESDINGNEKAALIAKDLGGNEQNGVLWTLEGEARDVAEANGYKYKLKNDLEGYEAGDYNSYKKMFEDESLNEYTDKYKDKYLCFGHRAFYYDSDKKELYYYEVVEKPEVPQNSSSGSEGSAEKKESGWDKVVAWWKDKVEPAWNNMWAEKEPEYTDEDRDVTRGLASFETDGKLFGIDRNLKSGDNFTVEIDGQSYAVESRGEVKREKAAYLYADAADVANGEVFLYGDGMFLKKDGKIYSVDARKLFGKGQSDKLKGAIKANSVEGEGGSSSVYSATGAGDAKGSLSADNFKSGEYEAFDKISFIGEYGESYKLQVRAVLGSDSSAHKAAVNSGISDGQLFRHGQDFYVKDGDTVLKMSAASGKKNVDYDKLVGYTFGGDMTPATYNAGLELGDKPNLFGGGKVTIYTAGGSVEAKIDRKVDTSKNSAMNQAAEAASEGDVFSVGNYYYLKTGGKVYVLESDDELSAIMNKAKSEGTEGEAQNGNTQIPDRVQHVGDGIFNTFTENRIKEGNDLLIPLGNEKYSAKCLYATRGAAYKAASTLGLGMHSIFVYGDDLYVWCGDYAMRLGAEDADGKSYEALKLRIKDSREPHAVPANAVAGKDYSYRNGLQSKAPTKEGLYSRFLT